MQNIMSKQDEDSGSDWDSMSEMSPPTIKQPVETGPAKQSANHHVALPHKLKSMEVVDSQMENTKAKDNPPYDFKTEVTSPVRTTGDLTAKPGKGKKGRTYDPQPSSAKHVTFVGEGNKKSVNGSTVGHDSDSEDPLYSTVKPRNTRQQQPLPEHGTDNTSRPKKNLRRLKFSSSNKKLEGVDNVAYEDDNERAEPNTEDLVTTTLNCSNTSTRPALQPQTETTQRLPVSLAPYTREEERMMTDYEAHVMHSSDYQGTVRKECSPPLIMQVGDASLESFGKSSITAVNRAVGESFAVITFPFTCFALFIHHFLRFLLQGVLKPLLVDTMTLVVEYLVRPLVAGVIKPLLGSVHVAVTSLSDTLLVCVRPLTAVLGSLRLVEVNYTRRYSVEDI